MLELEGLEVAVEAQVECEPPPDTWCHAKCQQHQVRATGGHRHRSWAMCLVGSLSLVRGSVFQFHCCLSPWDLIPT